ncbi:DMT family transporter [Mycoplasmatota bacterium WC30]
MNKNLARIILIAAGAIMGVGFVVNKFILDNGWNESQLIFIRFFIATILIFLFYFKRIFKTNIQTIKSGLFLGVFLYLGFYFQTWGLNNTTASNNALVTAGYIVLLPLIVYIMEKTKVPKKTIIAGFITLVGIGLITVDFKDLSNIALGDYLTFISAFFFALHIYFLGKKAKQVDLFVLLAFQLLIFSCLAFIVMMINGGFPAVDFQDFDSSKLLYIAIIMGVFGSFLAYVFQGIGQKNTNASEAAILISTESLFGPLFAILFLDEGFNAMFIVGAFLVFAGIVLSELDINNFVKSINMKRKKLFKDSFIKENIDQEKGISEE